MGTVSFIFKIKVLRASMTLRKTVSCLNAYVPCCSDTLQAPKICAVVHRSLLHRVQIALVIIIHLLRLVGDGSVSYVEPRHSTKRVSWHCHQRGPRKDLLNIVQPSCPRILDLQLNSF